MTLQIPPGFMQIALRFSLTGDPDVMVSTIGAATGGDPHPTLLAIVDSWNAKWGGAQMLAGYSFLGAHAQVGQDGGPPSIVEVNSVSAGTFEGSAPPSNLAILIRKVTSLGGRKGRGRMFWPPFIYSENTVDPNGMWVSTVPPAQNIKLVDWLSDFDGVLLHNDATPPTPIDVLVWDRQAATQRRRMRH